jgi:CubicO group peptidase (beta-lactamase class C family)
VLLGAIIEKVSGQTYYDYIQDHIYSPAGMSSSGSFWKNNETPNLAIGYTNHDNVLKSNYDFLPIRGFPAGGGYSTVEDLFKFSQALLNHKLLNEEFTEQVTTGKIDMPPGKYGYGFIEYINNGVRRIGHNGGAPGINAAFAIFPTLGYVVIVMENLDPPAADRVAEFVGLRLPEK